MFIHILNLCNMFTHCLKSLRLYSPTNLCTMFTHQLKSLHLVNSQSKILANCLLCVKSLQHVYSLSEIFANLCVHSGLPFKKEVDTLNVESVGQFQESNSLSSRIKFSIIYRCTWIVQMHMQSMYFTLDYYPVLDR